jgi:hypothetical protein
MDTSPVWVTRDRVYTPNGVKIAPSDGATITLRADSVNGSAK